MFRLGRDGEARAGDPPEADDTYSLILVHVSCDSWVWLGDILRYEP